MKSPVRSAASKEYNRQYKQTAKYRAYQKWYRKTDNYKSSQRKYQLKRFYNLTVDQYISLLAKQGGGCAICGSEIGRICDTGDNRLFVDHSHITNTVRGLLCARCNSGIGYFNDKVDLLRKAIQYLEMHG